ncbi:MAG: FUSC family protein [Candidatus Erginobacter occultus]|nr:FUSC family protein [Candidatus Erginobacter occultus]
MNGKAVAPNIRMGIQAALAVALALLVNRLLGLERPYWGGLMAVVVIAGSWGENLGKLKQLLVGTVAAVGGSVAFLYFAGDRPLLVFPVCLVSLFLWAYYSPTSYAAASAWMGAFAIILVSSLSGHRHQIALLRGLQVLIGGSLGILVSAFILPVGVKDDLERRIVELESFLREAGRRAFAFLDGEGEETAGRVSTVEIYRRLAKVIEVGRTAANQYIIFPKRRREIAERINSLRRLALYVGGLTESLAACRERELTPGLAEFFRQAAALVDGSFAVCLGEIESGPSAEEALGGLRGLLTGEINARPGVFPRRDLAPFLMFIHYVRGLAETAAGVPPGLAVHPAGHTAGLTPPPALPASALDRSPGE